MHNLYVTSRRLISERMPGSSFGLTNPRFNFLCKGISRASPPIPMVTVTNAATIIKNVALHPAAIRAPPPIAHSGAPGIPEAATSTDMKTTTRPAHMMFPVTQQKTAASAKDSGSAIAKRSFLRECL